MSGYLASIMQERPIVYLVAKFLRRQRIKFELEYDHCDLFVDEKRIEFKFNYDRTEAGLAKELAKNGDDLQEMWSRAQAGEISKTWGILARIFKDVCGKEKKPHLFVWIICSRDLSNIDSQDLRCICLGRAQYKYNVTHPYDPDGELPKVDDFLAKLNAIRPFSLIKQDIKTNLDFPCTYHFRICEFTP